MPPLGRFALTIIILACLADAVTLQERIESREKMLLAFPLDLIPGVAVPEAGDEVQKSIDSKGSCPSLGDLAQREFHRTVCFLCWRGWSVHSAQSLAPIPHPTQASLSFPGSPNPNEHMPRSPQSMAPTASLTFRQGVLSCVRMCPSLLKTLPCTTPARPRSLCAQRWTFLRPRTPPPARLWIYG